VNGFRCCDNIAPNAKCQRVFLLAMRLICLFVSRITKKNYGCIHMKFEMEQNRRLLIREKSSLNYEKLGLR